MNSYQVRVPYSGYSRGYKVFEVSAASKEEALDKIRDARYDTEIAIEAVRDDTECDWDEPEVL